VRRLLVIANVVPSTTIRVILMMEALRSSETSVLARATRRNIPEDGILHGLNMTFKERFWPQIRVNCDGSNPYLVTEMLAQS
jgi:hypothetical protein